MKRTIASLLAGSALVLSTAGACGPGGGDEDGGGGSGITQQDGEGGDGEGGDEEGGDD